MASRLRRCTIDLTSVREKPVSDLVLTRFIDTI